MCERKISLLRTVAIEETDSYRGNISVIALLRRAQVEQSVTEGAAQSI